MKRTCKKKLCKFNHPPEKDGARPKAKPKSQPYPPVPDVSQIPCCYNEPTIKQGRLTSSEDDQIPFVIGRHVYVITVEHGGQVYNLQHEVLRRHGEDRPFDFGII